MFPKLIRKLFGSFIAKVYLSVIKPSIDTYVVSSQLKDAKIGRNTVFYRRGTVYWGNGLMVGNNSSVGENFFFHAKGGIKIGSNTIISRNVTIYSANHNYNSSKTIPYDKTYVERKVTIGDGVWIGMGVYILPGVSIGDGAIIGMGSVVTKDVKEGEIVVSSIQKTIKKRNMMMFKKLKTSNSFYRNSEG